MEPETLPSDPPSPSNYVTAPTSPIDHATAIERAKTANNCSDPRPNLDDFEFELSRKFSSQFGTSQDSEFPAFADELFLNGLIFPLKLPPRLQFDTDSPVSSPKFSKTVCEIPLPRRSAWNDDFDPFVVALEKVREEKRGAVTNTHQWRSRSYSPFRFMSSFSCDIDSWNRNFSEESSQVHKSVQVQKPNYSGPLEFKGLKYARWARSEILSLRAGKNPIKFLFGQRARPVKIRKSCPKKPDSGKGKDVEENSCNVQKLKGILLKYASFGRETICKIRSEVRMLSCISKLSFKFKLNARKMAVN